MCCGSFVWVICRYDRNELEACMEAAWRHTDTLIFQSRYQEILLLVQDDPLEDLMRVREVDDLPVDTEFPVTFVRGF